MLVMSNSTNFIPENISSIGDFVEGFFTQHAAVPAYTALGQTYSYAQIDAASAQFASYCVNQLGLNVGDRIAIQLPNVLQNPIAVYGAFRAGLVVVNTNPLYTPREMKHQFNDSGAKALVILADFLPKYDEIAEDVAIESVIITSATELLMPNTAPEHTEHVHFTNVLAQGALADLPPRTGIDINDVAALQYTGGTTGVSKGAALSHSNIISNCIQTLGRLGDNFDIQAEMVVCPLPLYHIYAFTVCMMAFASRGAHTLLIPNPRDPDAFIAAIKPHQFTTFAGINTLFVGLASHPDFKTCDFSKLKLTISGGTALTQAAVDAWRSVTGCEITEGYGLSETAPVAAFNEVGNEQYGTVGLPVDGTEIAILADDGLQLPQGESGEIAIRGPQVMLGYWQRPDATAEVMTADGYFKTGDVGIILNNGCIKIVDRLKDMIIVSGFNVYPNEVEEVLTLHPSVLEAAVIGKPDDKTGERVCAYVALKNTVDTDDIEAHCRKLLTAYKVPKEIHILDELPKSSVGKLLRRMLRD
jgi:long-chain acyl-CoA synthetase